MSVKDLHHIEQMEALRRDFQKLWHRELLKRMQLLKVRIDDYSKHEDIAWQAFRKGKGL